MVSTEEDGAIVVVASRERDTVVLPVRDINCDAVEVMLRLPDKVTAIVRVGVCDVLVDVDADTEGEGEELGDPETELDALGLVEGRAESVADDDSVRLNVDE